MNMHDATEASRRRAAHQVHADPASDEEALEAAWSDFGLCGSDVCRTPSHKSAARRPADRDWPFDESGRETAAATTAAVVAPSILRTSARFAGRAAMDDRAPPPAPYAAAALGQSCAADAESFPPDYHSNNTTMVTSNVSSGPGAARERAVSEDSAATGSGSVSKRTLVQLMREQVDLVRSLTNAQIAQKQELERVKAEKRRLEQQQQQQQQHQQQHQHSRRSERHRSSARGLGTPPSARSSKLNLPTHHPHEAGDARSVSSRSFFSGMFARKPRRHPDADYFGGGGSGRPRVAFADESPGGAAADLTLPNGDPSAASTILPSAILIDPRKASSTGAFGDATGPAYTGPGARSRAEARDRIEITPIPERCVVPADEGRGCLPQAWRLFARLCTLFLPDCLLCCIGRRSKTKKGMSDAQRAAAKKARGEARQAWREKVAIFVVMLLCSAAFIGVSGVVPMFLCRETTVFTMDEIKARDRTEDWTVIFGVIYDVQAYAAVHPGDDGLRDFVAKDASKVFPRRPPGRLPSRCVNRLKPLPREADCDDFDEVDRLVGLHCHTDAVGFRGVDRAMGDYEKGVLAHRPRELQNDVHTEWLSIYGRVYNVTKYIDSIKDELSREIDPDSDNAYLSDDLNKLLINTRGEDATAIYEALYDDDVALSCLDDRFYVGVLDEPDNILCRALNIAMYTVMIMIAAVLGIQCICSLIYLVRLQRTITRDDTRAKIIVMVPCYNEGDKELRKTIDSVMDTSYPDDNKVLLVIADGNITGKGERISTPETLAKILGFTINPSDKAYKCTSIGNITENRATLHYGIYTDAGKELKYLVVAKCGTPSEKGSARAGNRGKRDSQLLFSGLLNRFHHGRALNDLDRGIKNALDHMQISLDEVKYLMAVDADTRVDRESISHMTYSMNKNDRILALCGETKVDNKAQSWVTMIQVFEYYTNHHMKKAFESVFGCVTCLPGCFTMYRLFSDDGRPLLSCDDVYQRYATNNITSLHDKNLYHLGEDRMLTTLLLRYFPDMRLSFVPEATCYTIVPHTFSVLLSQRRRWINSTFHNMLELMRVDTMCGICCLSMKSIVILDLVATLILPASLIYVAYIAYVTFWMGEPLSLLMLIVWGIVVGVQVVVFLLRSRWDYWWWFFVFVLAGVPVFYFILPLYSFWHMDDFSWGSTRQVSNETKSKATSSRDNTVVSDKDSPEGFEIEDLRVAETNERERRSRKDVGRSTNHRLTSRKTNTGDEQVSKRLNLKPKLHCSVPVDVDDVSADEFSCQIPPTKFDPKKYRDAEEAKRIRNLRRGEC